VAHTLSLYTGGVCDLMVHIWFSYTSTSTVFMFHCCYSALSTADGSPLLCAVLLFQALLLFWALWFCYFCFLHYDLHIPVCHMLRVTDPDRVAPCKQLLSHCTGRSCFVLKLHKLNTKFPYQIKSIIFIVCLCYSVTLLKIGNHAVIHSPGY
jgi:hypothetical protein